MSEPTATLIALNGQRVSVAESKKAARLLAGYRLPADDAAPEPVKRASPKPKPTATA
jgi:hypothetical protein